jgi:transposase
MSDVHTNTIEGF